MMLDHFPYPTIAEIQARICARFKVRQIDLVSDRRAREIARPRQAGMYLAKKFTPRSLPQIGRQFGGRDHTTVIHAVRQIEKLRATDAALDEAICDIERALDRTPPPPPAGVAIGRFTLTLFSEGTVQ